MDTLLARNRLVVSRRQFVERSLVLGLGLLLGCKKSFTRTSGTADLGEVDTLLFPRQHIARANMLVLRDDNGWAAMSTRCTYEGCDLTYQEHSLFCSCCRSEFTHDGVVMYGPAANNLPYYEVYYRNSHLFAKVGTNVSTQYRFTTPEIEKALVRLRERVQRQGRAIGERTPEVLRGQGDGEGGTSFADPIDEIPFDID